MQKSIYVEEYRELLAWLCAQRKERRITMRDLGARLGVHHSWVGRVEQGERRLDIVEFSRLCEEIGCDPGEGLDLVLKAQGQSAARKVAEPRPAYGRGSK